MMAVTSSVVLCEDFTSRISDKSESVRERLRYTKGRQESGELELAGGEQESKVEKTNWVAEKRRVRK